MRAPLGLPIPLLCYLTELVGAQTLEFLSPAANALTALGDEVRYDDGEVVEVQWRSDYDDTNLEVWQGPQDDGTFVVRSLGSDLPPTNNSLEWRATAISGANSSLPFHFQLSDAQGSASVNSIDFYIRQGSVSSSSSVSSATSATPTPTTSSSSSTSTSTAASPAATTPAPVAGAGADSNGSSGGDNSLTQDQKIGLGVGLGVGIPVVLAIIACIAFCLWRRRKRRRTSTLPRGRQHIRDPAISESQTAMRPSQEDLRAPPLAWMSTKSSKARSSTGAASTASSYFEPFEFERPGSAEFETRSFMSELTTRGDNAGARLGTVHEDRPMTPNWPLPR